MFTHRKTIITTLFILIVTAWFTLVCGLGWAGAFQTSDRSQLPMGLGLATFVPLAIFLLICLVSRRFRRFLAGVDPWAMTIFHTWRVAAGVVFIILWSLRLLPASLALPAGLGDIVEGVTAPFVAAFLVPRLPATSRRLVLWNLFGMLDLVVAIALGVLNSPSQLGLLTDPATFAHPLAYPLGNLPITLIPCFFVPATLMVHIASLLHIRQMRARARKLVEEPAGSYAFAQS